MFYLRLKERVASLQTAQLPKILTKSNCSAKRKDCMGGSLYCQREGPNKPQQELKPHLCHFIASRIHRTLMHDDGSAVINKVNEARSQPLLLQETAWHVKPHNLPRNYLHHKSATSSRSSEAGSHLSSRSSSSLNNRPQSNECSLCLAL